MENQNIIMKEDEKSSSILSEQDNIEKSSLTKLGYKKLKSARKRALHYGVTIPKLNYTLDKPEKPRNLFLIAGLVLATISIICLGLFIIFGIKTKFFSMYFNVIFNGPEFVDESWIEKTLGFSFLLNIGIALIYVVLTFVAIIPILLIVFAIKTISMTFDLANASYQELGGGHGLMSYILKWILFEIILVLFLVIYASNAKISGSFTIIIITFAILIAMSLFYIVVLILERIKNRKKFKTLPKEKQEDFLKQDRAIRAYKSRKNLFKHMDNIPLGG